MYSRINDEILMLFIISRIWFVFDRIGKGGKNRVSIGICIYMKCYIINNLINR